MSHDANNLLVAVVGHTAFLKIVGRANVAISVQFKTLVAELGQRGGKNFLLDLTECATMDSTFLGVLAGVVVRIAEGRPTSESLCVELLNPNERVAELLENLGVAHLFKNTRGINPVEAALQPSPASSGSVSPAQISKTCLEAHQLLMAVNPENIPKFKDVTQFLAEDLKKMRP